MAYRNRKLLDLAHRVNDCLLQLPGPCIGYSPEGCEPAHSNQIKHGKGQRIKADDFMHVAACHSCHMALDHGHEFSHREKCEYFNKGWERTIAYYFKEGWIDVK